jgi:glutamine synthetase
VPLRRVSQGRWEIRCLDGFANPYLALSALLSAGLNGVESKKQMVVKDCTMNPAQLTEAQLDELGIINKMPNSIGQSLEELETDEMVRRVMGSRLIDDYVVMKRAEKEMLDEMDEKERHAWLVERY